MVGKCKNCGKETRGSFKTGFCRRCFLTIGNPSKRLEVRRILRQQKLGERNPQFGKPTWNKGLKGYMAGEKNANWKGGKTPFLTRLRTSIEYDEWRKSVFKRDRFICQSCGGREEIQADHIKPVTLFPELVFSVDNGRTLCKKCHKKTITYGKGSLTVNGKIGNKTVEDYKDIVFTEKTKKQCLICGKEFVAPAFRRETAKFCSQKCCGKSRKGKPIEHLKEIVKKGVCLNTGRTHFKKGLISWCKGTKGLVKLNIGSFKKGHIPWNKGLKK